MPKQTVTDEQKDAIESYAFEHGEGWRECLLNDWMRAGSRWSGPYHLLHQLRNSHGSDWLATYPVFSGKG